MIEPDLGSKLLNLKQVAFWHGVGTVSLPHTDDSENLMCVVKGWKQFTIVSPFESHLVYAGFYFSSTDENTFPPNYSPVNFDDYSSK